MANYITWDPNVTDTVSYTIEKAAAAGGPWSTLVTILHDLTGSNYNTTTGKFYYNDLVNPSTYWYRIYATDSVGQNSSPTDVFRASSVAQEFAPGMTPFGYFDLDPDFQSDADKIKDFTRKKLGDPVMAVHLSSSQIYASFEEACLEYSAIINSYQAKSVITSFLGGSTGSLSGSENKYITQNLEFQKKLMEPYGDSGPFKVNSSLPLYSASISLQTGVQKYDLNSIVIPMISGTSGAGTRVAIRDMFHFSPTSAYRFFGTTSAVNYLHNQFNFESFTPETIFYLLPIWEDILRGMQFETSNRVRRSNYSYELHNNVLTVFPAPASETTLHFTFTVPPDAATAPTINGVQDKSYTGVANLSNIPFGNIEYSKLNSISKTWIRRFAFTLAKEIEGQIRAKLGGIPIPNAELNLNGAELIADARNEQEILRNELKALLDEMTYDKLSIKQAEQSEALERTMMRVPLGIYIGNFWPFAFPLSYLFYELFFGEMSRMLS